MCVSSPFSLSLSCRVAGTRRQPHTPLSHRRFVSRVDIHWEGRVRARHAKNRNLQLAGAQQPSHSLPQATGGGARFASRLPISQSVQKKRGARGAREAWGLPISGTVQGKEMLLQAFRPGEASKVLLPVEPRERRGGPCCKRRLLGLLCNICAQHHLGAWRGYDSEAPAAPSPCSPGRRPELRPCPASRR